MAVHLFYDIESFRLKEKKKVSSVIEKIIGDNGFRSGEIKVVITDDTKLVEINKEFLGRDYLTDIITFDYSEGKKVSGELYISLERIKDNSEKFNVAMKSELYRVIFHGVLHLCGYNDHSEDEIKKMREMEELYLDIINAE